MRNYQHSKQQILDFILEVRSTTALSKKIGYSFDKVKRWHNGSKQFRWNEFCELCAITKMPLADALASTFGILNAKKKDNYKIVLHLKNFLRLGSANVFAKKMKIGASVMQRYLRAETFPDVEFVLEMMDQRPLFLDLFLDTLLVKKNTSFESPSMLSIPWVSAVANAASLKAHMNLKQFSAKWISDFLGLSEEQVNQAINLMLQLKLIEKKDGHYGPTLSRTLAFRPKNNSRDYANYIRYWMRRADQRFVTVDDNQLREKQNENLDKDAFRVFSASPESIKKITEALSRAEQEIHDILIQDTSEKTDVRVLLIHHFSAQNF